MTVTTLSRGMAMALLAALCLTSARADASQPLPKPVSHPASLALPKPAVRILLGDALLEEYRGGDPARRTVTLRGGEEAHRRPCADSGKTHS